MITWIWSKPREQWPESVRAAVEGQERIGEKPDLYRGRPYPAVSSYLKEHEDARAEVTAIVQRLESGSPPPEHRALAQAILEGMLQSLARLKIRFDELVWESDFVKDGSVDRVIERLRAASKAVEQPNGAWAVDASSHGLPKESTLLVFQRADGTSLYITRDIAYHLSKFARFARVIDVLGQDHQLHARSLDAMLEEIGESRRPTYVIYQDITVPEGGRMSTRGGSAVWLDELLAEAVERARAEVLARREDLSVTDVDGSPRRSPRARSDSTSSGRRRTSPSCSDGRTRSRSRDGAGRSSVLLRARLERAPKGRRDATAVPFDATRLSDAEELALVPDHLSLPPDRRLRGPNGSRSLSRPGSPTSSRTSSIASTTRCRCCARPRNGRAVSRWSPRCAKRSVTPSTSSASTPSKRCNLAPSSLHASANNAGRALPAGRLGVQGVSDVRSVAAVAIERGSDARHVTAGYIFEG